MLYLCVLFVSLSPNSHANARQICFIYAANTICCHSTSHIAAVCLCLVPATVWPAFVRATCCFPTKRGNTPRPKYTLGQRQRHNKQFACFGFSFGFGYSRWGYGIQYICRINLTNFKIHLQQ